MNLNKTNAINLKNIYSMSLFRLFYSPAYQQQSIIFTKIDIFPPRNSELFIRFLYFFLTLYFLIKKRKKKKVFFFCVGR